MDEQYKEYVKFTDNITGDGARREKMLAALAGEDNDNDGKKKKKKKKKR